MMNEPYSSFLEDAERRSGEQFRRAATQLVNKAQLYIYNLTSLSMAIKMQVQIIQLLHAV